MNFDLDNISATDLCVALDLDGDTETLCTVPSEKDIRDHLVDMARITADKMAVDPEDPDDEPLQFDPGEDLRHSNKVVMPLADDLAARARWISDANAPNNVAALDDPGSIAFYYARFEDDQNRKLIGVRSARFLKGVTNKKLFRRQGNEAQMVEGQVLSLDNDFDFLIDVDGQTIYIVRPGSFEIICALKEAILAAAEANVTTISQSIDYISFDRVTAYATKHPTAARMVASIARRPDLGETKRALLSAYCQNTQVALEENDDGNMVPEDGHVLGFLKVLDRRRYPVNLTDEAEVFEAMARRSV